MKKTTTKEFSESMLIHRNLTKRSYFHCLKFVLQNIPNEGLIFGPGDLGSIPGRVIPRTLKMVIDTSLLNTQQYKVRIEGKVEQSRERSSALPNTSV